VTVGPSIASFPQREMGLRLPNKVTRANAGGAASVANMGAAGRPYRSVLPFVVASRASLISQRCGEEGVQRVATLWRGSVAAQTGRKPANIWC